MTESFIMFGVSAVFGLISTVFWKWVSTISKARDKDSAKLDKLTSELSSIKLDVAMNYQSKTEAHRDSEQVLDMLKEIKNDLKQLNNKLDRKADK